MNINNKLITFAQNELVLGRSAVEREKINKSLNHLETILKNKLGDHIQEFIRFGSYTRNTILPRNYDSHSDVDLMVVMRGEGNQFQPETYRTWLRDIIKTSYPSSLSKKDFPAVKLELNHIMFDLVPAYTTSNFLGWRQYYIPDRNSNYPWQRTDPNDINNDLKQRNQEEGNNLIRNVIRLCKYWNANAGHPMPSYEMEKKIISYWGSSDLFNRFLETMKYLAGGRPGVNQALTKIREYQGSIFTEPNIEKQFFWLQKLLPALK